MIHDSHYARVFGTFLRNSLVREMSFRSNFFITVATTAVWFVTRLVFFEIIYRNVNSIGDWNRLELFAFLATWILINGIVETFFMPNLAHFSELIRKGDLDFVLLKPIDTQFLVSFERVDLATVSKVVLAAALLGYSLWGIGQPVGLVSVLMYLLLVAVGVTFFYSLMVILASTSIWFGRNQGLYDFWFYMTVFARYPRGIYAGRSVAGDAFAFAFSFVVPVLLVVTVPARVLLSKPLQPSWLTATAVAGAVGGVVLSRGVFHWSLRHYRSASS